MRPRLCRVLEGPGPGREDPTHSLSSPLLRVHCVAPQLQGKMNQVTPCGELEGG